MAGAMAEYDAIEDATTDMTPATRAVALLPGEGRSYALNGTPADTSTHGIVIKNGKKIIQ